MPALAPVPLPPPPPAQPATLPHFRAAFDGSPDKLAFYLNCVWPHIDHYGDNYPNNQEIITIFTENLEGEAAEWVTQLLAEATPELGNIDKFLQELRKRFEDMAHGQEAEAEIEAIKQEGAPSQRVHWRVLETCWKTAVLA